MSKMDKWDDRQLPFTIPAFCEIIHHSYSKFLAAYTLGKIDLSYIDYDIEKEGLTVVKHPLNVCQLKPGKDGKPQVDPETGFNFKLTTAQKDIIASQEQSFELFEQRAILVEFFAFAKVSFQHFCHKHDHRMMLKMIQEFEKASKVPQIFTDVFYGNQLIIDNRIVTEGDAKMLKLFLDWQAQTKVKFLRKVKITGHKL